MHTTEQLNTALTGRYTIERRVGEGGMATVYLARDVKHNRKVALKVLKPDLGAIVGVDRFLSEIEVTANLQHPNLLPLFDSGAANGLLFYVMPFVEGESLRARLDREKQLPVDDAVRIATAVARALDYAHQHGVIHRDLKPENILLQHGQPVVADFGIALAVSNAGGNRVTQTGLSLGTPQYMSPEQATGDRAIDARTDVYSLGAVIYEMLTGEPPHSGSSSQAVIARLLTERPRNIRATRPSVPVDVEAAVEHALEKLPADRFGSAREFADALSGARPVPRVDRPLATANVRPRVRRAIALLPWVVALGAVAFAVWSLVRQKPLRAVPIRFSLELPDKLEVATFGPRLALSPDGTQLAFTGRSSGGSSQLYVRRLVDPTPVPLRGTEGASHPSFSPDGQALVFTSGTRGSNGRGLVLRTVSVSGGSPRDIARDVSGPASWVSETRVVFVVDRGLDIVSGDGGDRRTVLKGSATRSILGVDALPDGRHGLVTYATTASFNPSTPHIGVVSLDDGTLTDLGVTGIAARYAAPGYLLFGREAAGEFFAAPFSLRRLEVTGNPVLLLQSVNGGPLTGSDYAVSQNGTLAYVMGSTFLTPTAMFVVDRRGVASRLTRDSALYAGPRISPDGRRVAFSIGGSPVGLRSEGVFVYDVATGTSTPLSTDSNSIRPAWTADGSTILYRQQLTDSAMLWSRPWNRSRVPQIVARGSGQSLQEVGPGPQHGFTIIRNGAAGPNQNNPTEVVLARTDSLGVTRPLFSQIASIVHLSLSPNGRLLAYASNEGPRSEVYVTPIPGPGPRLQVSASGGSEPAWSRDGTQLYYRSGTLTGGGGWLMSAAIAEQPELSVTGRDSLFADEYARHATHTNYDVFPDGRLLMLRPVGPTASQRNPPFVIVNWPQLIEKSGGRASR